MSKIIITNDKDSQMKRLKRLDDKNFSLLAFSTYRLQTSVDWNPLLIGKMKNRFRKLLFVLLLTFGASGNASESGEEYVSIYRLISKGDEMLDAGLRSEAAEFYNDARQNLVAFRNSYPSWNRQVIHFRLKYLNEKLANLPPVDDFSPILPVADDDASASESGGVPSSELDKQTKLLEGQLAAANEQLRQLTADNALLLSKLREAMSARPADLNPAEFQKAKTKILELEKEKELIEVHLQKATESNAKSEQPAAALTISHSDLIERIKRLQSENEILKQSASQFIQESEDASIASLKRQNQSLLQEKEKLRQQLADAESANKRDWTQSKPAQSLSPSGGDSEQTIQELEKENDDLRVTNEALMQENAILKKAAAKTISPANLDASVFEARIQSLEKEKNDLQSQLAKARRTQPREKRRWLPRIGRRGPQEVSFLEARLAVFEAEKEPYTAEELALLGDDWDVAPVSEKAEPISNEDAQISPALVQLESSARTAAREGRFDEAESQFRELLQLVPNHAPSLASLALTQMKQQKFEEAQTNLETSLGLSSENSYALFLMGLLKVSQERYDDAVTFLSRATVLDPDDAEAQNYLGVALAEVGHRNPAETALRKAIRLRPQYTDAHINLAIVYASQSPPFKALAKHHYQKAINAGHPPVPRIEQLLNQN